MWACPWETFFFSLRRGLRAAPLAALFCGGIDRELLLAGLDEDRKLGEYRWDRTQRGLSPATYLPEASPGIEGAGGPSQRELEGDRVPLEPLLLARLLLAGDRALGALAGARVGPRALPMHGKAAAVADTRVAADLDLAADVGGHLAAEVTLDLEVALDVVAQLDEVVVGQVADPQVRADPGGGQRLLGAGAPDAVDVRERDLEALLAREVDADEACHVLFVALRSRRSAAAPVPGVGPGPQPPSGGGVPSPARARGSGAAGLGEGDQPWRCLWRKFSQITMTRP